MEKPLVFVTGGTGFLGRHLVPALVKSGYKVRLLVRSIPKNSWLRQWPVELLHGDINHYPSLQEGVKNCDYLIHGAGLFRFWGKPAEFWKVNVEGTQNVVKAASDVPIKRLVHISTIAVVGAIEPTVEIDEDVFCRPQDGYQKAKFEAESVILTQRTLNTVILRPGAFYGPYSDYGFNRLFIGDPLRGVRVQFDQGQRLTFPVYVPDVAKAIIQSLSKGKSGEIFNICDQPVSHLHVNKIVSELLGISDWRLNTPRWILLGLAGLMEVAAKITRQEPFFPLNLRYYVFNDWKVSNQKAKDELGFEPTPLIEGLRATVKWYLTQK